MTQIAIVAFLLLSCDVMTNQPGLTDFETKNDIWAGSKKAPKGPMKFCANLGAHCIPILHSAQIAFKLLFVFSLASRGCSVQEHHGPLGHTHLACRGEHLGWAYLIKLTPSFGHDLYSFYMRFNCSPSLNIFPSYLAICNLYFKGRLRCIVRTIFSVVYLMTPFMADGALTSKALCAIVSVLKKS